MCLKIKIYKKDYQKLKLLNICIKAGCPKDGIVLDPFMGAGTTAVVAKETGRSYIGIELNKEYITLAEERIKKVVILQKSCTI